MRPKTTLFTPKGRPANPAVASEVRATIPNIQPQCDLLLEYLHRLQDRYHCLRADQIVALADAMKLAPAAAYRTRRMATNPELLTVPFTLDGQVVEAGQDETILQAALRHGVEIPCLCYVEGMRADGNCRACVVELEGERLLAPSCCRHPTNGM